jgi:hypothetical protein
MQNATHYYDDDSWVDENITFNGKILIVWRMMLSQIENGGAWC